MPTPAVQSYPWEQLETLGRAEARASRLFSRALGPATARGLAASLGDLLSVEVELARQRTTFRTYARAFRPEGIVVDLTTDGGHQGALWVEAALADAVVSQLLRRVTPLTAGSERPGAAVSGAVAAVAVEALRRSGATAAPELAHPPPDETPGIVGRATLLLDGRPYRAGGWLALQGPPRTTPRRGRLTDTPALPITLGLVAARVALPGSEVAALAKGDVVVPGQWFATTVARAGSLDQPPVFAGTFYLSAPGAGRALELECFEDGRVVITGHVAPMPSSIDSNPPPMDDESFADTLLDTPVVAHVEVGSVSLPAGEWAALRPGDVLETGVQIGQPVVLRVGGAEIARGELVSIEGQVGVRIHQVMSSARRFEDEA